VTTRARPGRLATALAVVAIVAMAACGGSQAPAASQAGGPGAGGDYVADGLDLNASVAISTDGQHVLAFTCDGAPGRTPTFAQWFSGTQRAGALDLTNPDGARLVASLTPGSASGKLTLKDGRSLTFTVPALDTAGGAGLYRSDQVLNGVAYLAGWIYRGSADVAGAVVDEGNGAVFSAPRLDGKAITVQSVTDPNVGTYTLAHCVKGACG
jgi:hypothetical protein